MQHLAGNGCPPWLRTYNGLQSSNPFAALLAYFQCSVLEDVSSTTMARASEVQSMTHEFSSAAHMIQQVC